MKEIIVMKKIIGLGMAALLAVLNLAGCGTEKTANNAGDTAEAFDKEITVCSREDGSGTRGAFIELFGIEEKNAAGEKTDNTTSNAEITNSTAVMLQTIAGNEAAIGYVSLGSMVSDVKALRIDGAEATADNVKSGSYKISRPFNIVTKGEISHPAQEFINYILSDEGQAIVESAGYISEGSQGAFEGASASGRVTVTGSSSVTPVMEKLAEAYQKVNKNVVVDVQQNDSTTGITSAIEALCDIGMASRALKEEEIAQGAQSKVIAIDGIAVIVNRKNPTDEMSSETVKSIFKGEITSWSETAK